MFAFVAISAIDFVSASQSLVSALMSLSFKLRMRITICRLRVFNCSFHLKYNRYNQASPAARKWVAGVIRTQMDIISNWSSFDPFRFIITVFNLFLSSKHLIFLLSLPHQHDLRITARPRTVFPIQSPRTTSPPSITSDNPSTNQRAPQKCSTLHASIPRCQWPWAQARRNHQRFALKDTIEWVTADWDYLAGAHVSWNNR